MEEDKSINYKIKNIVRMLGGSKHSLGQHFLIREDVVKKMVESAKIKPDDSILEIGPGLGVLTKELIFSPAKEVIACERDERFFKYLQDSLKNKKMKLINQDALILIPSLIVKSPLKVISNLPYNISSPTIISLLTVCPTLPGTMVLMLQKEVAERLTSSPGSSNRGILTVLIELMGHCKIIEKIPRSYFYPQPEVESAVILIDNISPLPFLAKDALKIIKLAFAGKRKMIKNTLFSTLKIPPDRCAKIAQMSKISLDQRPEELTREQWLKLIKIVLPDLLK
jgi:16S rRNA (adenine1518-N6/adenine1519-N6)-dimethyltransferase